MLVGSDQEPVAAPEMATGRNNVMDGVRSPSGGRGLEVEWIQSRRGVIGVSAAFVALLILLGPAIVLAMGGGWFARATTIGQVGIGAATSLAWLFGALVLALFPEAHSRSRRTWVATGFLILGAGGVVFGWLWPMAGADLDVQASIYLSLVTWTLTGLAFTIGLLPHGAPACRPRTVGVVIGLFVAVAFVVVLRADDLPALVHLQIQIPTPGGSGEMMTLPSLEVAATRGSSVLQGLTDWYWVLSSMPLVLALAAAAGAARGFLRREVSDWLVFAMVLLAGAQLHALLWPSGYSLVLTTADILQLMMAAVVAAGGAVELRRFATERAALLALEREQKNRLVELAALKTDFTAMVTHELGSPLAAIRTWTALAPPGEPASIEARALLAIREEMKLIDALVADIESSATIERDDFNVSLQPVPVAALLREAAEHARSVDQRHELAVICEAEGDVLADPGRIGQVLRNLLNNAARYSPAGTLIELRATVRDHSIRIEVTDHGPGIHPADLARIFEKFSRGRPLTKDHAPGAGLGLYLSRGIVLAHGSDIDVRSAPGSGATFGFSLERAR